MKIHNKLEIKTKDKVYTSFNNLLFPFAEALSFGEAYSNYLAIGTGVEQEDIFHLARFEKTVPLVDDAFNFDPLHGQLFLRKKWVLSETDQTPYEIVEVGLTANTEKENPRVANRFLVNGGDPIYRDAGEEMVFELTIYLEFDNSSNLKLTAGDNPLVKFFLGGGKDGDFFVARGYDTTDNNTIVFRDAVGIEKVPVDAMVFVEDTPPKITFNFEGNLSEGGINEFLLFIGDSAVARQNVQNVYGGSSSLTVELMPDEDAVVTLSTPNVEAVSKVSVVSTGEVLEGYSVIPYASGFQGAPEEVFNGLGLPLDERVIDAKTQDRIAFFDGNNVRIFLMTESGTEELDATNIDLTDGYMFLMFKDMFFVKCAHPDGTYSIRYYCYNTDNLCYKKENYYLSHSTYEGVNQEDYWIEMDGYTMDAKNNNNEFMICFVTDKYIFGYKTRRRFGNSLYNADTMMAGGFKARTIASMQPANKHQNVVVCYAPEKSAMVYRRKNTFTYSYDEWAVSIVRDFKDAGFPKVAKNHAYAVDDANQMIKLFSIESLMNRSIVFEGAKNIYVDNALDYAVVKYHSGAVRAFYIDASANTYEFSMAVPALEDEIDKFYVVDDYFLFRLKNKKYYRIKLDKNKVAVSPAQSDELIEVEVMADTTPGQDGGALGFSANIELSAVDETGGGGE